MESDAHSPMSDARARRLIAVAHCLLNQNAKVEGIATYPGIFEPAAPLLTNHGVGILQLPCPEVLHLGPTRPLGSDTYEQYDTPRYRQVCRSLAQTATAELVAYVDAGYCVLCVLGVDGSPSCAVSKVPHGSSEGPSHLQSGSGVFMEILSEHLLEAGLDIPMVGLPENPQVGDITATLQVLEEMILDRSS